MRRCEKRCKAHNTKKLAIASHCMAECATSWMNGGIDKAVFSLVIIIMWIEMLYYL